MFAPLASAISDHPAIAACALAAIVFGAGAFAGSRVLSSRSARQARAGRPDPYEHLSWMGEEARIPGETLAFLRPLPKAPGSVR